MGGGGLSEDAAQAKRCGRGGASRGDDDASGQKRATRTSSGAPRSPYAPPFGALPAALSPLVPPRRRPTAYPKRQGLCPQPRAWAPRLQSSSTATPASSRSLQSPSLSLAWLSLGRARPLRFEGGGARDGDGGQALGLGERMKSARARCCSALPEREVLLKRVVVSLRPRLAVSVSRRACAMKGCARCGYVCTSRRASFVCVCMCVRGSGHDEKSKRRRRRAVSEASRRLC